MILGIFTLVNVKVRKEGDGPFVRLQVTPNVNQLSYPSDDAYAL